MNMIARLGSRTTAHRLKRGLQMIETNARRVLTWSLLEVHRDDESTKRHRHERFIRVITSS